MFKNKELELMKKEHEIVMLENVELRNLVEHLKSQIAMAFADNQKHQMEIERIENEASSVISGLLVEVESIEAAHNMYENMLKEKISNLQTIIVEMARGE